MHYKLLYILYHSAERFAKEISKAFLFSILYQLSFSYMIELMKPFDIQKLIESMINKFDDSLESAQVVAPFLDSIQEMDQDYTELIEISQQRERYNVLCAFSHANNHLQQEVSKIFTKQVKDKILIPADSHRNRAQREPILKKFIVIEENLTYKIVRHVPPLVHFDQRLYSSVFQRS